MGYWESEIKLKGSTIVGDSGLEKDEKKLHEKHIQEVLKEIEEIVNIVDVKIKSKFKED
ncbi:MAG: hypothetical protein ACE5KE_00555 [Methanosarcinales archaeon]